MAFTTDAFFHHVGGDTWKLRGHLLHDISNDDLANMYRGYLAEKGEYMSYRKKITPLTLLTDVGFMGYTCKVCKNKIGNMSDKKLEEMARGKLFWTVVWCYFCKHFAGEFIKRNLLPNTSRSGYYASEFDNVFNHTNAFAGALQADMYGGGSLGQRRRKSRRSRQRKRYSRKRSRKR